MNRNKVIPNEYEKLRVGSDNLNKLFIDTKL